MVLETDSAVIVDRLKNNEQDRSVAWSVVWWWLRLAGVRLINVAHELAHFTTRTGCSQVFFFLLLFMSLLYPRLVMALFDC